MNVLKYSRDQIQGFIDDGIMKPENLKHYDICKALASGVTQEKAADKFGLTDDSYIRKIKTSKCPDCYKIGS